MKSLKKLANEPSTFLYHYLEYSKPQFVIPFLERLNSENVSKLEKNLDPKDLTNFLQSFFGFLGSSTAEHDDPALTLTLEETLDSVKPENRQVILRALCLATPDSVLQNIALSCNSEDNIIATIFEQNPYEAPDDDFFKNFIDYLDVLICIEEIKYSRIMEDIYLAACPERQKIMAETFELDQLTKNFEEHELPLNQILDLTRFIIINKNGVNRQEAIEELLDLVDMNIDKDVFIENINGFIGLLSLNDETFQKKCLELALVHLDKNNLAELKKFWIAAGKLPKELWEAVSEELAKDKEWANKIDIDDLLSLKLSPEKYAALWNGQKTNKEFQDNFIKKYYENPDDEEKWDFYNELIIKDIMRAELLKPERIDINQL